MTSIILISSLTSIITATLTYSVQQHYDYQHTHQLTNTKMGAVIGRQDIMIGKSIKANVRPQKDMLTALTLLSQDRLDNIIGDYYTTKLLVSRHPKLHLPMSKLIITRYLYGFPLQPKSTLAQKINHELTQLQDNGESKKICENYLLEDAIACEF